MPNIKQYKTPSIQKMIAIMSFVMVLFCLAFGYRALTARDDAVMVAREQTRQLTNTIADQVELSFLSVDLSLRRVVDQQYFNALFGGNLAQHMGKNFSTWLNETPQIAALMLVNDKGVVEVAVHKKGYERWIDYEKSLLNEPVFETMRDASDSLFFIGRQAPREHGQRELIVMSRKLNNIDGSFGGIVVAAVDPNYFTNFFTTIERGDHSIVGITLSDKTALVSQYGLFGDAGTIINELVTSNEPVAKSEDPVPQSQAVEGQLKVFASKALHNVPVIVTVALDERDFLKGWKKDRYRDIGFLALFIAFGASLSIFALQLVKHLVMAEESEAAAILASQAKSEFLANMSHELRTPLNAIIGFSEMMSAGYFGPLNVKQKERVHDINLCGTHLLQLISDILEFSKGDAGKLELVEEKANIGEIIHECQRMMNERLKHKSINLIIDVQPDLPLLWSDKRKVRQVLLNLMSNATKFTPENGTIKATAKIDQVGNMNLMIADTGIGIAEQDIPTALSVFGQVHRSQSHEGTGLGLPLCKMFAELHGGKLTIASTLGEGTTVRIVFPSSRVIPAE